MNKARKCERKIENLTEKELFRKGFDDSKIEFQGSSNEVLQQHFYSKTDDGTPGTKGKGKPEFVYQLTDNGAYAIVFEVKDSVKDHTSLKENDDPNTCQLKATKYAEDGVIHYLRGVRRVANVVGLAISAHGDELTVTGFICRKEGAIERLPITNNKILTPQKYLEELQKDNAKISYQAGEIKKFAGNLHDFLRDNMELGKDEKPLLVSGILLALKTQFRRTFWEYDKPAQLVEQLLVHLQNYFKDHNIAPEKSTAMYGEYKHVLDQQNVGEHLYQTVHMINDAIGDYVIDGTISHESYDFLGDFYREFLRYTGGDKQSLGIVLTPHHICELFCDLADRMGHMDPEHDVVTDICTGTAGFLVAAMSNLLKKANGNEEIETRVKEQGLCGVDNKPQMFTIACANMMLRGDGKSNIYHGDVITKPHYFDLMAKLKPTVAMLNPPYAKKKDTLHEFAFIDKGLELLAPQRGICIAIVPMRLAVDDKSVNIAWREKILNKHTLEAVMSMPDGLFPDVGAVTCIMVFKAGIPHSATKPTWLGYWKDDGFDLVKGERHRTARWDSIRQSWLDGFERKLEKQGESLLKCVSAGDEWCVEAYIETDYSDLSSELFELEIMKFTAFSYLSSFSTDSSFEECVNG